MRRRLPRPPFPLGPRTTTPLPQPERETVLLPSGDELAFSATGPADATVVVAVHGFRGSDMGLAAVLAPLDHVRVLSANLPGMGVSTARRGVTYDLDRLALVVTEFVEALDAGPVLLLGHSFGTVVCSAAVAARPELVRGLVLLAPITDPVRGHGVNALGTDALTVFLAAAERAPRRVGAAILDSKFPGEQSLPFLRRRRGSWAQVQRLSHEELPASFDPGAVLAAHRESTTRCCREFAPALAASGVPVAVVGGTRDQFASPARLRSFAAQSGAAHVELLDGAGHLMHYEDVDDVGRALGAALAAL